MNKKYIIKELSEKNILDILNLEKEIDDNDKTYAKYLLEELKELFNNNNFKAYGLFLGYDMIGYDMIGWGNYKKDTDNFYIGGLVISKLYRGKGLGKGLISFLLQKIRILHSDTKKVSLTVSPMNRPAIILYLKLDFNIIDFKKDYYGKGFDRLFLEVDL